MQTSVFASCALRVFGGTGFSAARADRTYCICASLDLSMADWPSPSCWRSLLSSSARAGEPWNAFVNPVGMFSSFSGL